MAHEQGGYCILFCPPQSRTPYLINETDTPNLRFLGNPFLAHKLKSKYSRPKRGCARPDCCALRPDKGQRQARSAVLGGLPYSLTPHSLGTGHCGGLISGSATPCLQLKKQELFGIAKKLSPVFSLAVKNKEW